MDGLNSKREMTAERVSEVENGSAEMCVIIITHAEKTFGKIQCPSKLSTTEN